MDGFVDPTTLTPLFTAQQTICAYAISDFYASSPRYLYYALLIACFVTHGIGWLANVFLGGAAAYGGVAAIEAVILRTHHNMPYQEQDVSIPLVSTPLNSTFQAIQALVTNREVINVQPSALELDIDPILAIVVTGYLVVLPMQCWSKVVRANRARHLLITIWSLLMLVGTLCALTIWPDLYYQPIQYKFCYPNYLDPGSINNDGWPIDVWQGSWNSTIWTLFSNLTAQEQLSDNCLYPCFNTSQILRRSNTLMATDYDPSTASRLSLDDLETESIWIMILPNLIYLAVGFSAGATGFLLVISRFRKASRIPVGDLDLFWSQRRKIGRELWNEFCNGIIIICLAICSPYEACSTFVNTTHTINMSKCLQILQFFLDVLTLTILALSMILSPLTIISFIVWIEWYIRHDTKTGESVQQVGQWSTYVSVALVLVSAVIYRLKYVIASRSDIEQEIQETQAHLRKLEALIEERDAR